MAKVIRGGQVVRNTGENGRITRNREKEYSKRREYSTKTDMKKTSASAGVK